MHMSTYYVVCICTDICIACIDVYKIVFFLDLSPAYVKSSLTFINIFSALGTLSVFVHLSHLWFLDPIHSSTKRGHEVVNKPDPRWNFLWSKRLPTKNNPCRWGLRLKLNFSKRWNFSLDQGSKHLGWSAPQNCEGSGGRCVLFLCGFWLAKFYGAGCFLTFFHFGIGLMALFAPEWMGSRLFLFLFMEISAVPCFLIHSLKAQKIWISTDDLEMKYPRMDRLAAATH